MPIIAGALGQKFYRPHQQSNGKHNSKVLKITVLVKTAEKAS